MISSEFSGRGKRSLLCLYYPQQLLPGLAAVMQYRQYQGDETTAPLVLFVWSPPNISDEVLKKRLTAFELLLQEFPWVSLWFPQLKEIGRHLSCHAKVTVKALYLINKFGKDAFSEIYYAHDVSSDFIAQSAMQAFPRAKRVCFGDALGVVYRNDYFESLIYPLSSLTSVRRPTNFVRHLAARLRRRWTLPPKSKRLDASTAVLILPCDPEGYFLEGKDIIAVSDKCVKQVLCGFARSTGKYWERFRESVYLKGSTPFLMLLGAYSEARLCSEEQEISLYLEVARTYATTGSRLILKQHPSARREKSEKILRALSSHYLATLISEDLDEFPIEALPWLLQNKIILSFSYSSVSLVFLFSADVIHVMNDTLINTFFPQEMQSWIRGSNNLYLEQMAIAKEVRNQAGVEVWSR